MSEHLTPSPEEMGEEAELTAEQYAAEFQDKYSVDPVDMKTLLKKVAEQQVDVDHWSNPRSNDA